MVWEQRVCVIVMTTRTVERGRTKCGQYWPLEPSTVLGQFYLVSTNPDPKYLSKHRLKNFFPENSNFKGSFVKSKLVTLSFIIVSCLDCGHYRINCDSIENYQDFILTELTLTNTRYVDKRWLNVLLIHFENILLVSSIKKLKILFYPQGTQRGSQKISANLVQPFGQL